MTSASEIAAQLLAFSVAEFAATVDVDLSERTRTLLYSDFEGVAISGPDQSMSPLGLKMGAAFPIAVGYRMPGVRSWDVPIARNSLLVARNTVDGRVLLRDPFAVPGGHKRHSQRAPLDRGKRPPDAQFAKASADIAWVDGKARGLTDLPGEWHLNLVWYDWVSNELTYAVTGELPEITPRTVYLPVVDAPAASPEMPAALRAPAIALNAARRKGHGGVVRVSGRISLPMRVHMEVEDEDEKEQIGAVFSLTLLLMAPNSTPYSVRFHVPAQVRNDDAEAAFTLDVGADGSELPKGPLVMWGISDEALVGPIYIDP